MASLALGVKFNPAAGGLTDFAYSSAVLGYVGPAATSPAMVDGKTYRYRAESADLSQWEFGYGVYTAASQTIARTTITLSSTGAKVSFTAPPQVGIVIFPTDVLLFDDAMSLTTAQQNQALINLSAWDPGDAKLTFRTTASQGWFICDDGSIGDASSGATTRANADTAACFTVLYNAVPSLVLQNSAGTTVARGASAAADYAAHSRLVIPKTLGRSIAIAGAGSGLTSRTLGSTAGAETETPTLAKTAAHAHSSFTTGAAGSIAAGAPLRGGNTGDAVFASDTQGSGTPLNILDPKTYMNILIKL